MWWHTRLSPVELDAPSGECDPAHLFTPVVCRLRLARPTEEAAGPSWLNCLLVLEPHCGPFPHPFLSLTLPSLLSIRGTAWTLKSPELGSCCRKFFGETVLFSHSPSCGFWHRVDYFTNIYIFKLSVNDGWIKHGELKNILIVTSPEITVDGFFVKAINPQKQSERKMSTRFGDS